MFAPQIANDGIHCNNTDTHTNQMQHGATKTVIIRSVPGQTPYVVPVLFNCPLVMKYICSCRCVRLKNDTM